MALKFNNNDIASLFYNGNEINELKYNGITVYTKAPDITYLYNEGDECSSLTGGWSTKPTTGQGNYDTAQYDLVKNTDNMSVTEAWTHGQGCIYTNNAIDMTGFTKLCAEFSGNTSTYASSGRNSTCRLGIELSEQTYISPYGYIDMFYSDYAPSSVAKQSFEANLINLPITQNVQIFIMFHFGAKGTYTIHKIWLE